MGEWLQRAALIESETVPSCQRRLSEPAHLPETCQATPNAPDYRQHPERYEFPRFVIPSADGPVEFRLAVPKERYDAFAILDIFIKHHGAEESGQRGAKVE
jgi:hypothetical protein